MEGRVEFYHRPEHRSAKVGAVSRSKSTHKPPVRRGPGTVRIIGGEWKRRVLPVADVDGLRPTPDRVRETLFNWLTHAFGDFSGRSVLDLFAGTGALGIEAASRGATAVTLVESNATAARGLRAACAQLGARQITVSEGDAITIARELGEETRQFDLVLLDPPFAHGWIDTALPQAVELCAPEGFVYVEQEMPLDGSRVRRAWA